MITLEKEKTTGVSSLGDFTVAVHGRLVRIIRDEPVGQIGQRIARLLLTQTSEALEERLIQLVLQVVLGRLAARHGLNDAAVKEESNLLLGAELAVAAVHRVALLVGAVSSANALWFELARLLRVCGSDQIAPALNRVLFGQLERHNRPTAHERHQTRKELLARVVAVELAALLGTEVDPALLENGEPGADDNVLDLFELVRRVWLHHGQCSLYNVL